MPPKSKPSKSTPHASYSPLKYLVALLVAFLAYYLTNSRDSTLLTTKNVVKDGKYWNVPCSSLRNASEECKPRECGRFVQDDFITPSQVDQLRDIADRAILKFGKPLEPGPSIFDLASGAVTYQDKFISLYKSKKGSLITQEEAAFMKMVYERIQATIQRVFNCKGTHLTSPSFFSRISGGKFKSTAVNQEYYHEHVDEDQYGTFDYTGLIYLSDFGTDFKGGEFSFTGKHPQIVQPRKGRFSCFTSSKENPHKVHKVETGVRYALTVAFSCSPSSSIGPVWEKLT